MRVRASSTELLLAASISMVSVSLPFMIASAISGISLGLSLTALRAGKEAGGGGSCRRRACREEIRVGDAILLDGGLEGFDDRFLPDEFGEGARR